MRSVLLTVAPERHVGPRHVGGATLTARGPSVLCERVLWRARCLVTLAAVAATVLPVIAQPEAAGAASALDAVQVDSPGYRAAGEALESARQLIVDGQAHIAEIDAFLAEWTIASQHIRDSLPALQAARDAAQERYDTSQSDVRRLAAFQYVAVGSGRMVDALFSHGDVLEASHRHFLLGLAGDASLEDLRAYYGSLGEAEFHLKTAQDSLTDLEGRIAAADAERAALAADVEAATAAVPGLESDLRRERRAATVVGTDLPFLALEAYWSAAGAQQAESSGCGLSWTILAGIGRVESDHGRYGSAQLAPDGTTTIPIIGIALDGDNETAVIGDTEGGAVDGDAVHDRAVGPMQFIPTTWGSFGRDGNGDGWADPHNIYDAARSAAAYLCRTSGLDDGTRLREAILTYNYSNTYVDAVLRWAERYRQIGV
jgi:hypothetical protein